MYNVRCEAVASNGFFTIQDSALLPVNVFENLPPFIILNNAPFFVQPLIDQVMKVNELVTYTLPNIVDIENDAIIINVNLGSSTAFTTYNDKIFKFTPTQIGTY